MASHHFQDYPVIFEKNKHTQKKNRLKALKLNMFLARGYWNSQCWFDLYVLKTQLGVNK